MYDYLLQEYPEDARFLKKVLGGVNKMKTRTGIKASVKATRMSGEMNTSLGNGFSNLMMAKYIAYSKGGYLDGYVEGDDGIFTSTVKLESADYLKLGFTIKMEEVEQINEASFCGMIFATEGQIIRNPSDILANFGWTSSFINAGPVIMGELLRAKALSTVYETGNCPIIGVLARRALLKTRQYKPRFVDDGYHKPPDERRL